MPIENTAVPLVVRRDMDLNVSLEIDFGDNLDPTEVGALLELHGRRKPDDPYAILSLSSAAGTILVSAGSTATKWIVTLYAPNAYTSSLPTSEACVYALRLTPASGPSYRIVSGALDIRGYVATPA